MKKKLLAGLLTALIVIMAIVIIIFLPYWIAKGTYYIFNMITDNTFIMWLAGWIIIFVCCLAFAIIGKLSEPIKYLYKSIYDDIKTTNQQ